MNTIKLTGSPRDTEGLSNQLFFDRVGAGYFQK
jgi:hypothetical protein